MPRPTLPITLLFLALAAPPAAALDLAWPVDCTLGRDCWIQQYVDRDAGPGASDFACGTLSYDGHKGTDIRLRDRAAMRAGVTVRAAAPGVVEGVRDGMADIAPDTPDAPEIAGRECGNGVVLRHAGGWSTQYCHLARGSLRVRQGEGVAAGAPLGRIGLSGASAFPHLHLTLRDREGRVVDPFDGRPMSDACGADRAPLWSSPVAYRPGGLLNAGFADAVPSFEAVKEGAADTPLARTSPAVVAWGLFYGLREGDRIVGRLLDPGGSEIVRDDYRMPRARALQYRAFGKRMRAGVAPGVWTAELALVRGGAVVERQRTRLRIE